MANSTANFYDALAEHYHLIFDDWEQAIRRQASVLNPLLTAQLGGGKLRILDCACGIGTQAIGFAQKGHGVVASDLSPAAIARARREAAQRGLDVKFHVANMVSLSEIVEADFDVVAALDNALPHLSATEVRQAVHAMGSKLRSGGLFTASIRDYDRLVIEKPTSQGPAFYGGEGSRRIVHQVWDWIDESAYVLHLYITVQDSDGWETRHFASEYRCLQRAELTKALDAAGFEQVRWLMPDESGYYQPLVLARRR
jgi:SAM-dependent methyltransferase